MGKSVKTLARMAENGVDSRKVVYPSEIGRAEWSLDNPPSAVGLKLLLLVVSALGDTVADDVVHELPVSLLRQVPGLAGMGKDALEQVLLDLTGVRARLDVRDAKDPKRGCVTFGALLSTVRIHYSDDAVLSCHVRFGDVFRDMVAASELFAVIDRALALSMKSRYSLLLYQFLATHWRKEHQRQLKLPLSELRRVFALSADAYAEFKSLKQRALAPAVAEISDKSPYSLTVKPYYEGSRAVAGVVLSWEAKAICKPAKALPPASGSKGGKAAGKASAGGRKPAASASAPRAASDAERLAALVDHIKARRLYAVRDVKAGEARELLASGAVSSDDLRACQIYV